MQALLTPLQVLRSFPAHDYTLDSLLRSRCAVQGARPMLKQVGGGSLTWSEFAQDTDALARALLARGVTQGDCVAIVARNSMAHVLLLFSLARIGAIAVPLNPELGVEEMHYALRHARVAGVITTTAEQALVEQAVGRLETQPWVAVQETDEPLLDVLAAAGDRPLPDVPPPDTACVMIFTSGTTGFPKGVLHSQRSLLLVGEANLERLRLQTWDRILVILPFFHINALFYSLGGLLACGGTLLIAKKFSASRFWQIAADEGATVVNIIEAMGTILKARDRTEFRPDHQLRTVYGVRQNAQAAFREEFGVQRLFSGFGMTEIPGVTCNPYDAPNKPGSMGVLARHPDPEQAWARCRIVDAQGQDLPDGESGELWVQTPVVMQGYFQDPEQTRQAFCGDWFKTGDIVQRDADGFFFYISRQKDIIRRRGENISGAELDRVVGEHPAVFQTAAVAVPSELGEDDILVAIVLRPGAQLQAEDVRRWCSARLSAHKVPRYVAFVASLPHTPTHKISKAALRQDPLLLQQAVDLRQGAPR